MHQLLSLRTKIYIVIGLAFAISWIATALGIRPIGVGATVSIVEFAVINFLLNSWGWLHDLPFPLPGWAKVDLSGVWEGEIVSQYQESPQAVPVAPIMTSMDIHQSWHEIILNLDTANMGGKSHCACPSFDKLTRTLTIRYFFETSPTVAASGINPPQRNGSAIAEINYDHPNKMTIKYTNERGRGGDIVLQRKRPKRK